MVTIPGFFDRKPGVVVDSREEPAACQRVEPGIRVPPPDVNTLVHGAVNVPLDRCAMRAILGRDTEPRGEEGGPDLLQSDQTDPDHADAVHDFRPKGSRQQRCQDAGVNMIVDQDAPIDDSANNRYPHVAPGPDRAVNETRLIRQPRMNDDLNGADPNARLRVSEFAALRLECICEFVDWAENNRPGLDIRTGSARRNSRDVLVTSRISVEDG